MTPVWRLSWRAANNRPVPYWVAMALFAVFFTIPSLVGWLGALGFEALTDRETNRLVVVACMLVVTELLRGFVIYHGAVQFMTAWDFVQTLFRHNMLSAQVTSGGPTAGPPVASSGEAVSRFRDDPLEVAEFVDAWIDVFGGAVFAAVALGVLAAIDMTATLVVLIPMAIVAVVVKTLDDRVKQFREADRTATIAVTGAIGDVLSAATTIKVNGATNTAVAHIERLGDVRRSTAVKDRVLEDGLLAFSNGSGDVAFGLVLLVSIGAIRSGDFGLAEFAVFTTYLAYLSFLPRMIGRLLTRRKQAEVSFNNMAELVADGDAANTVTAAELPIHQRDQSPVHRRVLQRTNELKTLDVAGLSVIYPGESEPAVGPLSFTLEAGSFTVISGRVGTGKTSLLRALLGLEHGAEITGNVCWNGEPVADRAAFFVPPQSAFLSQVPNLLSDSVADNILLGLPDDELGTAMRLSTVDRDIAAMENGIDTLVGPRGLRLSGGQRQRLAAARAIVARPSLLVLDDVSSALDVETELELWKNLAASGVTILAVSNRAVALEAADQVIDLGSGLRQQEATSKLG